MTNNINWSGTCQSSIDMTNVGLVTMILNIQAMHLKGSLVGVSILILVDTVLPNTCNSEMLDKIKSSQANWNEAMSKSGSSM